MFDDEATMIRYHLPTYVPPLTERVWLETGTAPDWVIQGEVPDYAKKSVQALRIYLRHTALARGGEWRATTERGELLSVFSVSDLKEELSGEKSLTLHPRDQFYLAVAKRRLSIEKV
jgi:hypothetical protein